MQTKGIGNIQKIVEENFWNLEKKCSFGYRKPEGLLTDTNQNRTSTQNVIVKTLSTENNVNNL
jgi:hypothetical protein